MKNHWRIIYSLLPASWERQGYERYFLQEFKNAKQSGSLFPPPHLLKQRVLKEYRSQYKLDTLVETGTYLGDMIYSLEPEFETLYSIELSRKLFERAKKRFKGHSKVHLLQGDSGKCIKTVVEALNKPALFWLDGHYSGGITAKGDKECPVYEELTHIFQSSLPHVVLIDDARLFIGKQDYPTIEALREFVERFRPNYQFEVKDDSIRLTPA